MSKVRVYEVARDLGLDPKQVVTLFQSIGVTEVKNHMSAVGADAVERIKRHLDRQQAAKPVEEHIRPGVVKRRVASRAGDGETSSPVASAPPSRPSSPSSSAPHRATSGGPASALREASTPRQVARAEPIVRTPKLPPAPVPAPVPPPVEPAPLPTPAPRPEPVVVVEAAPPPPPPVEVAEVLPAAPPPAPVAPRVETPVIEAAPAPEPPPPAPVPEPALAAPVEPPAVAPSPVSAEPLPPAEPAVAPPAPPAEAAPAPPAPSAPAEGQRPSVPPPVRRTGIDVWEGRPGVPMPAARGTPQPRRQTFDAKAPANLPGRGGARPGAGPGRGGPQGRGAMRRGGIGSFSRGPRTGGAPVTQERSAHKKVVKIEESIGLQGLGIKMGVKAQDLLRVLVTLGLQNVNINTTLDSDTAKLVANEFGWEVEDVAVSDEDAIQAAQGIETEVVDDGTREVRPPVVTVMGHVDHGKTSLLDAIRKSNVVAGEAGGITQHVAAYSVETPQGRITFLDTPGHEAFTSMRARGANVTDIVILVVAADDGVMPQTREAVNHARAAHVPIVVAVNKCDKPEAQPERVRRELSEIGLIAEEWGGDTLMAEVSAVKRTGIDTLLEQVMLGAEMLELRANPNKPAIGTVIEAQLDRGKGPVATVLIEEGTLNRGDVVLAGSAYGKVRAMIDSKGRNANAAGPATPVAIIGLTDVPSAGDPVHVVKDMKIAEKIAEKRRSSERSVSPTGPRAVSFEDIIKGMAHSDQLELKLIVKADVQGSVEALSNAILKLSSEKVKVTIVNAAVGAITEGDVNLAVAAGATIIGFNARPAGKANALAQQEKVEIRQYNVIYNVVDDVRGLMEGMLAPTLVEKQIGKAEVRTVFKLSKAGIIAGSMVLDGLVRRNAMARVQREGAQVYEGKISSLKRFKEDVREVKDGFECGIGLDGFNDIREGDLVEVFDLEQVKQTL
ncbi:MAG: translation initiation factor IF-2 [Polyangiaceae bacterium]|nr:translation initiation factor IF-2 [Polyangiaceae bacterium]